jgi:hypothetical protein
MSVSYKILKAELKTHCLPLNYRSTVYGVFILKVRVKKGTKDKKAALE